MNKNEKRKLERQHRLALTLLFSGVVFVCFLVTAAIAALAVFVLVRTGVMNLDGNGSARIFNILRIVVGSILLGTLFTVVASRIPLRPVNRTINALNRLAGGDFKTRLHFGRPLSNCSAFEELSDSFNTMAAELENTQMLREDFINNFSHEFKTPIVSIAGFASLLRRGGLTEERRQEYIEMIEEESTRLSVLATNILNLNRIEKQTALADVTRYSLSEQVRVCVLLLQNKWEKKKLEMQMDFGEYEIEASEELLHHVWLNLIDNAVKFAPEGGQVRISIRPQENSLEVAVHNTGEPIPPESMKRIFQKFYQADASRATQGNGIGLTIVQKAVALHGGSVKAESGQEGTTFCVTLPQNEGAR